MKAFLSHSSTDKEFVEAVSRELGRQFCVVDSMSFEGGVDFITSIEKGLAESKVFVLFASRKSMTSDWVSFEIEEVRNLIIKKNFSRVITYLIDISIDDPLIPEWLKRAKIRSCNSPKVVAREIKSQLDQLLRERQHPYFIGRTLETEKIEKLISPWTGAKPPHALCVTGLPGIGRRTFIGKISESILNLRRTIVFKIKDGDDIYDLAETIADCVEPWSTQQGFNQLVSEIRQLSESEVLARILKNLRTSVCNGELPIIFDSNGLLDGNGRIHPAVKKIVDSIESNDTAYIFIVSHRRPNDDFSKAIPTLRLPPLNKEQTKVLISSIARKEKLEMSPDQISELGEYVCGFPPAVYFAIQHASAYGVSVMMGNKRPLVEFKNSFFTQFLSRYKFTPIQENLLSLLSCFSPLPLSVIGNTISTSSSDLSENIIPLMDLSIIEMDGSGYYSISAPVRDSIVKFINQPLKQIVECLVSALVDFLSSEDLETPKVELSGVLYQAARRIGSSHAETAHHHVSDVIKLVESSYHSRDYLATINYAQQVLKARESNSKARDYLIRALIQEEQWKGADEELERLDKYAPRHDIFFLRGFKCRMMGDFNGAIEWYNKSVDAGRKGAAVKRELASCYLRIDDIGTANKHISDVLESQYDNRYILDLAVQISMKMGDEAETRSRLSQLKIVEDRGFYLHRLSTTEARFGNMTKALNAAENAIQATEKPTIQMFMQKALCEIRLNLLDEADSTLSRLRAAFPRRRVDWRIQLETRLALARGNSGRALGLLDELTDKGSVVYRSLRHDAISMELEKAVMSDAKRVNYKEELVKLSSNFNKDGFNQSIEDIIING